MTRIAVLDDYQRCAESFADWSRVKADASVAFVSGPFASIDDTANALAEFDVICLMRERTPVPRELLERLQRLKLIVLTGQRSQTFDIPAARELGIEVEFTTSGPAPHATPELTMGLILALARHIPAGDRLVKAGQWLEHAPVGQILHGSTLGLIGLGNVGSRVAQMAAAFGMRVIAWSPNLTWERAGAAGAALAQSKEELLRTADVISLHMVLAPSTRGLLGRAEFAVMKRTALVVNAARGPLIVEQDLVEALRTRKIGGAAVDVYDQEPLPKEHPLRQLDNIILTPHFGYVTREIYQTFYGETVAHLERFLNRNTAAPNPGTLRCKRA
jgi:phosphoglycerate dehydrogenase-like enzyme